MIYSKEVENMCTVAKGPKHGPAPIPEEGKWVKSYDIKDISGDVYKRQLFNLIIPLFHPKQLFRLLCFRQGREHLRTFLLPLVHRPHPVSYTHLRAIMLELSQTVFTNRQRWLTACSFENIF